jgi:ribosomal protein L7/L12
MDKLNALELIKEHAPDIDITCAMNLADAIVRSIPNFPTASNSYTRNGVMTWISNSYTRDYVLDYKVLVIKQTREMYRKYGMGLKEAKDLVDYFIDHPDSISW